MRKVALVVACAALAGCQSDRRLSATGSQTSPVIRLQLQADTGSVVLGRIVFENAPTVRIGAFQAVVGFDTLSVRLTGSTPAQDAMLMVNDRGGDALLVGVAARGVAAPAPIATLMFTRRSPSTSPVSLNITELTDELGVSLLQKVRVEHAAEWR